MFKSQKKTIPKRMCVFLIATKTYLKKHQRSPQWSTKSPCSGQATSNALLPFSLGGPSLKSRPCTRYFCLLEYVSSNPAILFTKRLSRTALFGILDVSMLRMSQTLWLLGSELVKIKPLTVWHIYFQKAKLVTSDWSNCDNKLGYLGSKSVPCWSQSFSI